MRFDELSEAEKASILRQLAAQVSSMADDLENPMAFKRRTETMSVEEKMAWEVFDIRIGSFFIRYFDDHD